MWLTKTELLRKKSSNKKLEKLQLKISKDFKIKDPEIVEHDGLLIVSGSYLKIIFDDIESIYTSFVRDSKGNVHDVEGGLTGQGMSIKKIAKMYKQGNCESYDTTVIIPYETDDLSLVIEHFLDVFPKDLFDDFDTKVFLNCTLIDLEKDNINTDKYPKIQYPINMETEGDGNKFVMIDLMVLRE